MDWIPGEPPKNVVGYVELTMKDGGAIQHVAQCHDGWVRWNAPAQKAEAVHGIIACWRWLGPPVPTAEEQGRAVVVWPWEDAPGELRNLRQHGDDALLVALLPSDMTVPAWIRSPRFSPGRQVAAFGDRTVVIGTKPFKKKRR